MTLSAAEIKRLVNLRQYENYAAREVQGLFEALRRDLIKLMERYPLETVSPGYRERRAAALIRAAEERINTFYRELALTARANLVDLGQLLAKSRASALAGQALNIALTLPTRTQIRAILATSPIEGAVMRTWWAGQSRALRLAFSQQVRIGLLGGETLGQMVNRVRGTYVRPGVYEGGIMNTSTRKAQTLIRTAVNHVHSQADQMIYQQNALLVPEYEIVATLDARTTVLCASLDGQRFSTADPEAPRPPFHWNCRTTTIPVVDYSLLGLPQPPRTRQTYQEWFDKQPLAIQESILGPSRAALVRSGEAGFVDLVRNDGRLLSLEALRAKL